MSESEPDTDGQRQAGHALWRGRAANWDKWADELARQTVRLDEPILEAAAIAPGQSVLDLASGLGQPAFAIAERLGPSGQVTASDAVDEMLAGLRRRVAERSIANISVDVAEMEELPYADASFDRVTCRFGIMFTPNPQRALEQARRVLKPGGIAAFMVWGEESDVTLFRTVNSVVKKHLGETPHEAIEFTPFRFGEAGLLSDCFHAAGFHGVAEQELKFAPRIDASIPFWRQNLEMSLGQRFDELDEDMRRRLDDACRQAFRAYRDGDVIQLSSLTRLVTGLA